jgi:hypothetical protein
MMHLTSMTRKYAGIVGDKTMKGEKEEKTGIRSAAVAAGRMSLVYPDGPGAVGVASWLCRLARAGLGPLGWLKARRAPNRPY